MTRNTPRPHLRRRGPLVVAAGAALTLVAAGPASAALTTGVTGTGTAKTVLIAGDGADDSAALTCVANDVRLNGATLTPTAAACSDVSTISVSPGAGDDIVDLRGVTTPAFQASVTTTVDTAAGQDQIFGGTTTNGGDGNDRFIDHAYGGSIDGGAGTDSVEYDFTDAPSTVASFTITPTTLAATINNGAAVSTAVTGVEQYYFSTPDGTAQADVSTIDGRGQGTRTVARMHSGVDTFYGGTSNDVVDLGPGTDVADPGAGNDTVQGGEGDDTISVRDNEVDVVDCGDGTDTVTADRVDVLKNCENVNLPPLPPPAPTPAPETGGVVGLKKLPRGAKASFVFVSPTAGVAFQCRVDSKNWKTCRSPYKLRTDNLSVGKHKLFVRALLSGNNVDASPSKFGFTIQKPKPKKRR